MKAYIGLDVGKINTKAVVIDENENIIYKITIENGKIISDIKKIFRKIKDNISNEYHIYNIGVSGENRFLVGKFLGTDTIINEIECIKEYAKERKIEGNILELSSDNYKLITIKDNKLMDYQIYKSSNIINTNFIYKVSNLLKINIDNIKLSEKTINFKNDNLILLYEEIKLLSHNNSHNIILSSLVKKMIDNLPKYNYIIINNNSPILKYINISNYESYYAIAKGIAILSKNTKSKKIFDLNIENNTIERTIEACHKCNMNCEIVSIYRNNELIDSFGNKCQKGKVNEYIKEVHYM